jgi:signal transduction histidine kinase
MLKGCAAAGNGPYFYFMKNRNSVTLLLMTASMVLLLVLQILWLRNSYEKALVDLRRETNSVFRSTVFAIRDSLFLKNIQPDTLDTSIKKGTIESVYVTRASQKDSALVKFRASSVQVFVNSSQANDSIIQALKPMASNFSRSHAEGKSFIIRLEPDSVSIDSLTTILGAALNDAGFASLKFSVQHERALPQFTPFAKSAMPRMHAVKKEPKLLRDTLLLDPVLLNPVHEYEARVTAFRGYLLKEISPQIIFSIFLTLITGAAFWVLYRNLRAQQRVMELKNDFISNVTHELKTPVATVSVALEALKNFNALNNPALTREYLDIAQNELNRLTYMTDKILKAAVFESNGVVIEKERIDLNEITHQILESLKLLFEKQRAQVSFIKEGDDFTMMGSRTHLTNVIYNLLDNALKYATENPELKIILKATDQTIQLTVQDNGMGIPSEYQKKIFEKFFRVPTGNVHTVKGYGLGLSYVAGIIKKHKGTITVESTPGKGSTFMATLPKN